MYTKNTNTHIKQSRVYWFQAALTTYGVTLPCETLEGVTLSYAT